MAVVLIEMHRQPPSAGDIKRYVLKAETVQHQIGRQPTVITIPGEQDTGQPNIIGYDLGIVQETITANGLVDTGDSDILVDNDDPAYEGAVTKYYPIVESLRTAALYWWADANWGEMPPSNLVAIYLPYVDDPYEGIIQQMQFTLDPAHDFYRFSLVFRVTKYEGA